MNRILVPVDFSVESDHALEFACVIARKKEFIVEVLNVFKAPPSKIHLCDFDQNNYQKECDELNWNRLSNYLSQKKFDDVRIRMNQVVITDEESVSDAIISMVNTTNADLVIMGNKAVSGIIEELNDSIAAKVMREISTPFISLKGFVPFNSIPNILYTSEYDELEVEEPRFEFVKLIAELFESKIFFLYIENEHQKNRQNEKKMFLRMKQLIQKYNIENYHLIIRESEDLYTGLSTFIDEQKVELIVVGYHADRIEKHKSEGSIAENLIHGFSSPVLTLKF